MTMIQRVAQVFGWVFVIVAVWGAVITGTSMAADPAVAPKLWGLFPVNLLHNLVHLGFGIWGIMASRSSHDAARTYAIAAGAIYIVLSVLGIFAPAGFGLVPLGGADIWLHAFLGVALLVAGVTLASRTLTGGMEPAGTRTVPPPNTASSPTGTVTRPPAQPAEPEGSATPVEPRPAGSEGAAEAAPPPAPPQDVVEEPRQQPDEPAGPGPVRRSEPDDESPGGAGGRTP